MKFPRRIPFVEELGLELLKFEGGQAEIALDLREALCNSRLVAHGGVLMSLLDVVMAHAARSPEAGGDGQPRGTGVVTIEMKTSFMRPGVGRLLAQGTLVQGTMSLAFCEGTVLDERGRIVARASGTFKYLKSPPLAAGVPGRVATADTTD
jgi:uncharacterized protein (TIGR00369 family)